MSDTQPLDRDPIEQLLSGPPTADPAARFAEDLREAGAVDTPVRVDAALADLFAPPTPQPRRTWRPWVLLRPAATVAAAFVAVLVLGAGAVALVGPELVDTITGGERSDRVAIDAVERPDDIEVRPAGDREDAEVAEVADDTTRGDDVSAEDAAADHPEKGDANAVNEEAVAAWVSCTEAAFDAFLATFGSEDGVSEGLFADCPKSDEGSLGVAGHQYKDAMADWFQCVSQYAHTTSDAALDVVGACGDIPTFSNFGIDVPDDADADTRDRVAEVNQRSDELVDDRTRTGEGRNDDGSDVRNDSSDEGRSPGDRTGEG